MAARMTQTEIINRLAEETGLSREDVKRLFEELALLASRELRKNGEFTVPGFGKMVKAMRGARQGRNPATGHAIRIPAKTTVRFRLGRPMMETILSSTKAITDPYINEETALDGDSTKEKEEDR